MYEKCERKSFLAQRNAIIANEIIFQYHTGIRFQIFLRLKKVIRLTNQ